MVITDKYFENNAKATGAKFSDYYLFWVEYGIVGWTMRNQLDFVLS
ncbi:MAG: hypothetical protein R2883_02665 [Caldisericia bacterium]